VVDILPVHRLFQVSGDRTGEDGKAFFGLKEGLYRLEEMTAGWRFHAASPPTGDGGKHASMQGQGLLPAPASGLHRLPAAGQEKMKQVRFQGINDGFPVLS
jgi:hypothetical protein